MKIRCIDFETTGVPSNNDLSKHQVIQWARCDLDEVHLDSPVVGGVFNPTRPIDIEAKAVHHLTEEMLSYASNYSPAALNEVMHQGNPDVFVAHNAAFERQFLLTDLPWICTYKVALRVWPAAAKHNLQYLRYWRGLKIDAGATSCAPHSADFDAYLCALLLDDILTDSDLTIEQMISITMAPALLPFLTFGKYKNASWSIPPFDYLEWLVYKSDMDADVKYTAQQEMERRKRGG